MNEVQLKILNIYKEIKKICDENNIPYYAIGGTCIGAVRHQGIIPWDDDIDIAIPIEYLEKFRELCRRMLPNNLQLYTCDEYPHCVNFFDKVIDVNTTYIEEVQYEYPDSYKGVFVDVMVLAGIPINPYKQRCFQKQIYILNALNYVRRLRWSSMPTWKHKILWLLMRPFQTWIPFNYFSTRWLKMIKKYSFEKADYTGYVWSKNINDKLTFPKELFVQTVDMPFEDTYIKCPCGWHEYLSRQFGNYMQLPPENERESGHVGLIDLERSYREYQLHPEWIVTKEGKK